jgi:hypothetical protein
MPTLEQRLAELPYEGAIAFAAICAERALAEVWPMGELVPELREPQLIQALHLSWRFVHGEADPERARALDDAVSSIFHALPDDASSLAMLALHAVERLVKVLVEPARAASHARSIAEDRIDLVRALYADGERVAAAEIGWQEVAVGRIASVCAGGGELLREAFQEVPEYERGPLAD